MINNLILSMYLFILPQISYGNKKLDKTKLTQISYKNKKQNLVLSEKKVLKDVLSSSPFIKKIQLENQRNLSLLLEKMYSFSHLRAFSNLTNSQKKNPQLLVFDNIKEELTHFNMGLEKTLPYGFNLKLIYSDTETLQNRSEFLKRFQTPEQIFRKKANFELGFGLIEGFSQYWALSGVQGGKEANKWLYYEKAEELALRSAHQYWKTYLAWITYQQTQEGLKTYKYLVQQIQKKKQYGFLNPGERPQILAEYENIQMETDKQKQQYEKEKQNLFILINKDEEEFQIVFKEESLSSPPSFPKINIEQTRPIKIMKNKIFQQNLSLKTHQAKLFPNIRVTGGAGFIPGGADKDNLPFSQKHSFYELGLNFIWTFYSKSFYEKRNQEEYLLEENKIDMEIAKQNLKNKNRSLEREILASYKKAQHAKKSNSYQKRAFKELKKSFEQGRLDIFELIHTERRLRESEIRRKASISEYSLLLLQNLALRDQLVENYFKPF